VALNIFIVIIAAFFHAHRNVYTSACIGQKETAVYRDVGLHYRMWVRSPFWSLEFRAGHKGLEAWG